MNYIKKFLNFILIILFLCSYKNIYSTNHNLNNQNKVPDFVDIKLMKFFKFPSSLNISSPILLDLNRLAYINTTYSTSDNSAKPMIKIFDLQNGNLIKQFDLDIKHISKEIIYDGKDIIIVNNNDVINILNINSNTIKKSIECKNQNSRQLTRVAPNIFAFYDDFGTVNIFNWTNPNENLYLDSKEIKLDINDSEYSKIFTLDEGENKKIIILDKNARATILNLDKEYKFKKDGASISFKMLSNIQFIKKISKKELLFFYEDGKINLCNFENNLPKYKLLHKKSEPLEKEIKDILILPEYKILVYCKAHKINFLDSISFKKIGRIKFFEKSNMSILDEAKYFFYISNTTPNTIIILTEFGSIIKIPLKKKS